MSSGSVWATLDAIFKQVNVKAGEMAQFKSTGYSLPEEFECQHAQWDSEPSVTTVSGNLTPFSGLPEHQACKWCTNTCRPYTQNKTSIKNKFYK